MLIAVAAKRPQSIRSSMISLGTGSFRKARTERRVFNTSIASMVVCPPKTAAAGFARLLVRTSGI
jgi:hypothetical protein